MSSSRKTAAPGALRGKPPAARKMSRDQGKPGPASAPRRSDDPERERGAPNVVEPITERAEESLETDVAPDILERAEPTSEDLH